MISYGDSQRVTQTVTLIGGVYDGRQTKMSLPLKSQLVCPYFSPHATPQGTAYWKRAVYVRQGSSANYSFNDGVLDAEVLDG